MNLMGLLPMQSGFVAAGVTNPFVTLNLQASHNSATLTSNSRRSPEVYPASQPPDSLLLTARGVRQAKAYSPDCG
jgi:hypothetical protein